MTARERLVDLIKKAKRQELIDVLTTDIDLVIDMPRGEEYIADYLLANGVIVPPCKVGDTVWFCCDELDEEEGKEKLVLYEGTVLGFDLGKDVFWGQCQYNNGLNYLHPVRCFGETVFLTREEAEKALAERSKE